jgi:dephospho-CoA kinase
MPCKYLMNKLMKPSNQLDRLFSILVIPCPEHSQMARSLERDQPETGDRKERVGF